MDFQVYLSTDSLALWQCSWQGHIFKGAYHTFTLRSVTAM